MPETRQQLPGHRQGLVFTIRHTSTTQKPIERASERNDAEIERWRSEKWPAIKKKPKVRDAHSSG